MWKNYFRTAIRNLIRNKGYSLINIIGLAVGIAVCLLIFIYIRYELEYNKFNENIDNIYRILTKHYYGSQQSWSTGSPPALGPYLKENFPEIDNSCRFINGTVNLAIKYQDKLFYEDIQFADPSVFDIFSFPFILGSHEKAKDNIYTIVLSEKAAVKYFGKENPVGRFLLVNNQYELEVIGVIQNIPANSSERFDYMVPIEFTNLIWNENNTKTWYNCSFNTYVLLSGNVVPETLDDKIINLIRNHSPEADTETFLYSFNKLYLKLYGNMQRVVTVGLIACLILLIACINFVNLTTSRAIQRTKEIGIRKITGSTRKLLILQFMTEFLLLIFLSIMLALVISEILLPVFNGITGTKIDSSIITNKEILIFLPILWLLTGIFSGIYPAIMLSSFNPINAFKRSTNRFGVKSSLRKVLVTLQFGLSIALIIITLFVIKQTKYMRSKDIGYDRENIVYVNLEGKIKESPEILRRELLDEPGVLEVTFLGRDPTSVWTNGSGWDWEGRPEEIDPFVTYQGVDYNYLNTFEIKMAYGSFYTPETSGVEYMVINESFAEKMGIEDPTGMKLYYDGEEAVILGVVKDFNYKSNHHDIGPLILFLNNENIYQFISFQYAYMRIRSDDMAKTLRNIAKITRELSPDYPIEVKFLEADIERLYRYESQTEKIVTSFSVLAVFISCLGLFGLATFLTIIRTKEIGIRKVLGSSLLGLINLLTMNFIKWVVVANLIAWPLAYFFVKKWLENYPYRIDIGITNFILAGMGTLIIAISTVIYQTLRAAGSNPVNSLRYE